MWTLGINWRWHDGAAALVDGDGRLWALAEEERFTRVKHATPVLVNTSNPLWTVPPTLPSWSWAWTS